MRSQATTDNTSSLQQSWGVYIRAELLLSMGSIASHQGFKGTGHFEFAVITSSFDDAELGRVLVALFGSMSNYEHIRPVADEVGEIPSDVAGLYAILDRVLEPSDNEIHKMRIDEEFQFGKHERAEEIVRLLDGPRHGVFPKERFDVLFQSFFVEEQISPYDHVFVGSPIFIATPLPGSFSG